MPLLRQVAALLAERGADPVGVNLEIKYDAVAASGRTSRTEFVEVVVDAIRIDGLVGHASVQCFDWGVLRPGRRLRAAAGPQPARLAALPGGLRRRPVAVARRGRGRGALRAERGRPGLRRRLPRPRQPVLSGVDDPAYVPFATADLVAEAHACGLRVVPYVVDDPPTMRALLAAGVDGLIANRPDVLRAVLAATGRPVPAAFPGG